MAACVIVYYSISIIFRYSIFLVISKRNVDRTKIFIIESVDQRTIDSHCFFSLRSLSVMGRDYCARWRVISTGCTRSRGRLWFTGLFLFFSTPPPPFSSPLYIMYALDARVAFRSGVVRVRPLVPRIINNLETWISQGTARHPRRLVRVIPFFSFFFLSLASHAAEIVGVTARNTYACKRVSLVIRSFPFPWTAPSPSSTLSPNNFFF